MTYSPLLAGAALLALALPAVATPRAVVAYADLDFSRPADVATFNARLDQAAKKACVGAAEVQIDEHNHFVRCSRLAKDAALAQMPKAQRAALEAAQTPQQLAGR